MNKLITPEQVVAKLKNGMTIMIGGFLANGSPHKIIEQILQSDLCDLTLIATDSAFPDKGLGKLIAAKRVRKFITSHLGTNPIAVEQMNAGTMDVEFVPQGTIAERVRAVGAGLGGVLLQTGMNTLVEKGKEKIMVDGKEYLLEKPLHADVALIAAAVGDKSGNLYYKGTAKNMNPIMASAADLVIAEVGELVDVGYFKPEDVHTPGIFVDFMVRGER